MSEGSESALAVMDGIVAGYRSAVEAGRREREMAADAIREQERFDRRALLEEWATAPAGSALTARQLEVLAREDPESIFVRDARRLADPRGFEDPWCAGELLAATWKLFVTNASTPWERLPTSVNYVVHADGKVEAVYPPEVWR